MRILIAADYPAPFSGNFIGSVLDLAVRIRDRGDEVSFLFSVTPGGERSWSRWIKENGFQVFYADLSATEQEQLNFLKSVLKEKKIDLMHLHFGIYNRMIRKYAKELIPTKVLIHDHMGFGRNAEKAKRKAIPLSLIYAVNGYGLITVLEQKKNAFIFMPRKWFLPNGLSFRRNLAAFADRTDTRKSLGIREDEKLVTVFGWDPIIKGVDIAAQAIDKLRKQGQNVVLGLIGGNIEKYCSTIERAGLDPKAGWVKFIDSREDVFSLHRAADVLLSASRSEGFPYAILEAISQNTPVVFSSIPGTKWVEQYEKGVKYPTEDPDACADALSRALEYGDDPSNAEEIIKKYSIETWCDQILDIYDKMIS